MAMDTTTDAIYRMIQRIASHGILPGFCFRMELCEGRPWLGRRFLVELEESAIYKASEAKSRETAATSSSRKMKTSLGCFGAWI